MEKNRKKYIEIGKIKDIKFKTHLKENPGRVRFIKPSALLGTAIASAVELPHFHLVAAE